MIEELLVDVNNYVFQHQLMLPGISIKSGGAGLPQVVIRHLQSTILYASLPPHQPQLSLLPTIYSVLRLPFPRKIDIGPLLRTQHVNQVRARIPPTSTSDCALHVNHAQFTTGQTYAEPKIG